MSKSAALPAAYVFLRILIVLNWFFAACIEIVLAPSSRPRPLS